MQQLRVALSQPCPLNFPSPLHTSLVSTLGLGSPPILYASLLTATRCWWVLDIIHTFFQIIGSSITYATLYLQRSIGAIDLPRFLTLLDPELLELNADGCATVLVVEIAVTDSGCGLTENDALRLFEDFQQVP